MKLPERDTPLPSTEAFYGGLPIGWAERRLRFLCQIIPSNVDKHSRDDELPVELCNYTDVYYNDRITLGIQFMEATATPEQIARFGLQAGDTVITKDSETADDIGIPAFVPKTLPGVVCGYHLTILRPGSDVEGRFIHWLFQAAPMRSRLETLATGLTRVGLSQQALKDLVVPLPSLEEQRRIAAFLDHETARIDELVREQEQLIGLINEKRSAYVSHLVTQGQDSSAQKQDSGVELLGDIPSRWEVAKLGRLAVKIGSGKTPRGGATAYVDEGVLFLRSQNVYDDGLRLESVVYIDTDTDEEMRGSRVRPMDVLINITGASIGRATIVPQEFPPANVNQHVAIIRLRQPSELAKWIAVVLQTSYAKTLVQLAMSGAARDGLTSEELAQFRVPVPPTEERKAIIAHLEDLESDWTRLTDTAIQSKRLLLERRSALISAAVTGQLDLREWQPREPEAVAEVA